MNNFLKLTSIDNHSFSAYIAQPKTKPKAGLVVLQEIFENSVRRSYYMSINLFRS